MSDREFSDASTRGYAERQVAKTRAEADIAVAGIEAAAKVGVAGIDILKELVRIGVSNPIAGAASAIIVANILQKAKLIDPAAEGLVTKVALVVVGVEVGTTILNGITGIVDAADPFKGSSGPQTSPLTTSVQTVVFPAHDAAGGQTNAITRMLAGTPKAIEAGAELGA